jgi:dynactin 1
LQEGDWDVSASEATKVAKPVQPVVLMAETFKMEIKEAEAMKYKLENKDLDVKELKKVVKLKTDEMSEMQVRHKKFFECLRIFSNIFFKFIFKFFF